MHTDTGSRSPDLHMYRHSDRENWHIRLRLMKKTDQINKYNQQEIEQITLTKPKLR